MYPFVRSLLIANKPPGGCQIARKTKQALRLITFYCRRKNNTRQKKISIQIAHFPSVFYQHITFCSFYIDPTFHAAVKH